MFGSDVSAPGVTVIIPCYNYAHYLPQAIESCLSQGYEKLEVLVVDDDSKDDSVEVASSYGAPVRVLRQKNQGVGAARNHGMREASHEFVIFLDADDCLAPNAVKTFLEVYFRAPREPGVVAGCARMTDSDLIPLNCPTHPITFQGNREVVLQEAIMFTPFVPTVLARKDFLLQLGGFETNDCVYRGSEDKAMWITVAASSRPIILVGEVTVHYRVHQQSMSHNGLRQIASSQAVLKLAQEKLGYQVPPSIWHKAWAFSLYQMAIIYRDIGSHGEALQMVLKSLRMSPFLMHPTLKSRYGLFFRFRWLVGLFKKVLLKNLVRKG